MVVRYFLAALFLLVGCGQHAAREKAGPALSVDKDNWSFGTIERGEISRGRLVIANIGSDSLHLNLYSTCDCLSAVPEQATLPPGGKQSVDLSYLGDEIKAPVTKTVFIDSNDPETPRLAFKVTGTVTPGSAPHLSAIPDPLALDPALPTYPEGELKITNLGVDTLEIEEVTCFGCANTLGQRLLSEGEEAALIVVPLPDWSGKRWLEIRSNDPVQPLTKIMIVELD
jgi:hypothetical protein